MTEAWRPRPLPVPADGAPARVTVYEVGPRDGLQAEPGHVETRVKAEFCRRLAASGIRNLEVTSFVPAHWIPQLGDAEEVLAELAGLDARTVCLVPNRRGLDRAIAAGVREVAVLASATESFAHANLNSDRASSLRRATELTVLAGEAGLAVRGYVSMAFGDPWEGDVDQVVVAETAAALHDSGCRTVALGDTIGVATPGQVVAAIAAVERAGAPRAALALHLHDTYGQALANVHAALHEGVAEFDASAGGLGRCPYARGATGNLATEDLVWMLHGLGIDTGIDLAALVRTTAWMAAELGRTAIASRVATALLAAEQNGTRTTDDPTTREDRMTAMTQGEPT